MLGVEEIAIQKGDNIPTLEILSLAGDMGLKQIQ